MGNALSLTNLKLINFEDMQTAIRDSLKETGKIIIINTLPEKNQYCLISGTTPIELEEQVINSCMNKMNSSTIVIYGINSTDKLAYKKYEQLIKLGFHNVFIYAGGLFEWLLLQDIYGYDMFPTTKKENDLLKYKGNKQFNLKLIAYTF
jgi:hypothetical protein